jgi:hypothetical protein
MGIYTQQIIESPSIHLLSLSLFRLFLYCPPPYSTPFTPLYKLDLL